jgi:hypothetical protein
VDDAGRAVSGLSGRERAGLGASDGGVVEAPFSNSMKSGSRDGTMPSAKKWFQVEGGYTVSYLGY